MEKEERIAHLRMCIDDGFLRLAKVRTTFNERNAETKAAMETLTSLRAAEEEAYKHLEGARKDLAAWLKELERLV